MEKKNTGKAFELLIETIFKNLVKNPELEKVEHNIKLEGKDGPRQIDVLVTSEVVGIKFLTIIECRDYNIKLPVGHIDGFHSKLQDVNANKGVLISKLGFSSKAIAKAKRLGITLCTVQEVSDPNWNPALDLPVIIEEIKPSDFEFSGEFHSPGGLQFEHKKLPIVNGINLAEKINEKWRNGSLLFQRKSVLQEIHFNEIRPPYIIKSVNGTLIELTKFELYFKPEFRYFLTSINELKNTKILNDITAEKTTIFLDIKSISKIDFNYKKIPMSSLKNFNSLIISIKVFADIKKTPEHVKFEKIN